MNIIKYLNKKFDFKSFIIYTIFGSMATLVNMLSYHVFYNVLGWPNLVSTFIAWFLAVLFAFFTNKYLVFRKPRGSLSLLVGEITKHYSARAFTGFLDLVIMYVSVDLLGMNAVFWKFLANVLSGIINYLAGKFLIFHKK